MNVQYDINDIDELNLELKLKKLNEYKYNKIHNSSNNEMFKKNKYSKRIAVTYIKHPGIMKGLILYINIIDHYLNKYFPEKNTKTLMNLINSQNTEQIEMGVSILIKLVISKNE